MIEHLGDDFGRAVLRRNVTVHERHAGCKRGRQLELEFRQPVAVQPAAEKRITVGWLTCACSASCATGRLIDCSGCASNSSATLRSAGAQVGKGARILLSISVLVYAAQYTASGGMPARHSSRTGICSTAPSCNACCNTACLPALAISRMFCREERNAAGLRLMRPYGAVCGCIATSGRVAAECVVANWCSSAGEQRSGVAIVTHAEQDQVERLRQRVEALDGLRQTFSGVGAAFTSGTKCAAAAGPLQQMLA